MTVIHTPPNTIPRIESLWVYVSIDATGEGICGANIDGRWISLTTGDEKMLPKLAALAQQVSDMTGRRLQLVKMTTRENVSVIVPKGSGHG